MSDTARVTVCIPAYNAREYLPDLLFSLCAQGPYVEAVVADDASTDDTVAVARAIAAIAPIRIRVFEHEQNIGMFPNCRRAFSYAETDYVTHTGADDLFMPGYFVRCVDVMGQYGAAVMWANGWDMTRHRLTKPHFHQAALDAWKGGVRSALHWLHTHVPGIYSNCWIARRDFLDSVGGIPADEPCGDWVLAMRMMTALRDSNRPFAFTPDLMGYVFRRHNKQHSEKDIVAMLADQVDTVRRHVPEALHAVAIKAVYDKRRKMLNARGIPWPEMLKEAS